MRETECRLNKGYKKNKIPACLPATPLLQTKEKENE